MNKFLSEIRPVTPNWMMRLLLVPSMLWIIAGVLMGLTWLAWALTNEAMLNRMRDQFDLQVKDTQLAIEKRLRLQERALLGGAGLFAASEKVTRQEWKAYVDALKLEKNYPGMQGFGYTQVIVPRDLAQHIRNIRTEGFRDYDIKPVGKRDIYTAIVYLEPFDWRNQRAFGYDMMTQETRRAALERARDSGMTAMTGKVTLVQETSKDVQNGFLIYVPVYRKNMPIITIEQRRAALQGYVYSPFRINDLMQGTQSNRDENINFEIYDGTEIVDSALLYDSDSKARLLNSTDTNGFFSKSTFKFAGQPWTLGFSTKPEYMPMSERLQPWAVAGAGGLIDALVILLFYSLIRQHRRSVAETETLIRIASSNAAHTHAIANTLADGLVTIDDEGNIEYVNPAMTRLFGYSEEELLGKNVKMLMPEPYHSEHDGYLEHYKQTGDAKIIGKGREVVGQHKTKKTFPMELAVSAMLRNHRQVFVGIVRDVSEKAATSQKLLSTIDELEMRAREMTLLGSVSDVLQTCQDLDEVYKVVGTMLPQMFPGCSGVLYTVSSDVRQLELAAQWGEMSYATIIHQSDCLAIRRGLPHETKSGQMALYCAHFEPRQPEHGYCVPLLAQGSVIGMLTLFQLKITEQQHNSLMDSKQRELIVAVSKQIAMAVANLALRKTLEEQSIHDSLTGLHNRRFLQEMFPREIQRILRKDDPSLAVLMMDVDHFKNLNDTFGHAAGDRVLIEIARVLGLNSRREDLVCRYGGEEFVIVLPTISMTQVVEKANRIRNDIKGIRIEHDGKRLPVISISIGIAMLPVDGVNEEQLLHTADEALYAAKAAGRDQVVVASIMRDADSNQMRAG